MNSCIPTIHAITDWANQTDTGEQHQVIFNHWNGKKNLINRFDHSTIDGARQARLSIFVTADLMRFLHTTDFQHDNDHKAKQSSVAIPFTESEKLKDVVE